MTMVDERTGIGGRPARRAYSVLAIAASSGGPAALEVLLRGIDRDFPLPILVVQHMMPTFTHEFATWLENATPLPVELARNGEAIVAGHVYLAPENVHLKVVSRDRLGLCDDPGTGYHRPSANVLFHSVAEWFGDEALAVVLTGMGNDGVEGAIRVHESGGTVLVQDEASCVVFGMPSATIAAGAADGVIALEAMAAEIRRLTMPCSCASNAEGREATEHDSRSSAHADGKPTAVKRSDKERMEDR
jgi:two-component system chemotaxis response regulator CheB